jgi:stage IV sporulation protein B
MRKLSFFTFKTFATVALLVSVCNSAISTIGVEAQSQTLVYVGGMSAGFTLKSGGVQVVGLCDVISDNGTFSPALNAGLRSGDKIIKINGVCVEDISNLNTIVDKSKGNKLSFEVERGKENLSIDVRATKDKLTNKYKIGILARDSVSGIGTVTYINKEKGRFGALGHSVVGENKRELRISDGIVYECSIVGISKGVRGKAGELRGMFISDKQLGNADKLCNCGIFGRINEGFNLENLTQLVASSSAAMPGEAYIYSTVDGVCVERFEIEIVKVDKANKENKNYVIKITDEDLIEKTGGIVQGMSGSPIIQQGKLIGAVTHVFLNDPTRGYGIDVETMLKE